MKFLKSDKWIFFKIQIINSQIYFSQQFSFFGEYQLMFDLRSNFVVKVGGKEDFQKQTAKQDKTTFLCVSQDIFERLFGLFPKSKIVVQKRALERRRV